MAVLLALGAPVGTSSGAAVVLQVEESAATRELVGTFGRSCSAALLEAGIAHRVRATRHDKPGRGEGRIAADEGQRGAQLLVLARARSRVEGPRGEERRSRVLAAVELSVLSAPAGERLWSGRLEQRAEGEDVLSVERGALQALGRASSATLAVELRTLLASRPGEHTLELRAREGKLSPELLARFKDGLFISLDGVEEVRQERYRPEGARLVVVFRGSREELRARLDGRRVGKSFAAAAVESGGAVLVHLEALP